MRILHLIPNLLAGGAQQQLSYLAAEQQRAGHDVHVGYLIPGPKRVLFERPGLTLHSLGARGNHDPRLFVAVYRVIGAVDPDVVQTWLLQMDVLGGAAALLRKRPWVMTERASAPAYAGVKVRWRVLQASRADAVVSNSREGDAYWKGRLAPDARRVIRNGVPLDEIARVEPVEAGTSGLPRGNRVVLYAGRIGLQKNLETLVPALGVVTRGRAVTAYLCGDGTHERETRSLIAGLGPGCDVRFVGYVPDVWRWMKRADVFVSVSHFEGHPNTVLEAAACGCPLVLSDIPEHREMLGDDEAVFVGRFSPEAVARAIETVLADPESARRRAGAARAAVETFSVERMAAEYETLYREVIGRRRERGR